MGSAFKLGEVAVIGGLLVVGGIVIGTLRGPAPLPNPLPHEPYPYTVLPISSMFETGILDPFALLSVFNVPSQGTPPIGSGKVAFANGLLEYQSDLWSYVTTRVARVLDHVTVRMVWKPLSGSLFINEAWNADPDSIGHTAMIIFDSGKVRQTQYPNQVELMDFDPYGVDWVTMEMTIDYTVPEIMQLIINGRIFTHLPIGEEPIAAVVGFWQLQFFMPKAASVLIKEISAF